MNNETFLKKLDELGACTDARKWVSAHGGDVSTLWRDCERGDWMLWLACKLDVERKQLVRASCKCARQALRHVPYDDDRPRMAIEAAEAWCNGTATTQQVRDASSVATSSAAAYAASAASAAAAYAAYASDAAAYAAYAADAADAAAGKQSLANSANIVREFITAKEIEKTLEQ